MLLNFCDGLWQLFVALIVPSATKSPWDTVNVIAQIDEEQSSIDTFL